MFVLLDSWFLSRNDTNGRVFAETCYQCQRTRATHRNVETAQAQVQELQKKLGALWMFSPVSYAASIQCPSSAFRSLTSEAPLEMWMSNSQTATESTHISNQKLQPPQGAALQIQWSKDPFPRVYWITVSRKITYDQDEYTVQTSFHNETFIRP